MKALKTAAIAIGTASVIFLGALMLTGCQTASEQVQEAPSPTVAPSSSTQPKVVEPSVQPEIEPSPVNSPTQSPSTEAVQPTPAPEETVAPSQEPSSGFVAGTCKELRAQGLSDFRPGDPNYTDARDRDQDGVACES